MDYESTVEIESQRVEGVRFTVRKMSFGRRVELTKKIQGVLGKLEFLEAGEKSVHDEAEAALLSARVDREYLRWGLIAIEGSPAAGGDKEGNRPNTEKRSRQNAPFLRNTA